MVAYYNEIDQFAAQWLRNLIAAGHIAAGEVDERSIKDVQPDDIARFTQCHFFAGIGGWSYALRLAGWPDDRPVWTGSCPCQPFSSAGERKGFSDPRDLWPTFYCLIAKCSPAIVFGEQVESKDGRVWLSRARAEMEASRYRFGAADLCAAGIGSPQRRQRLYWLADADCADKDGRPSGWEQSVHDQDSTDTPQLGRAKSEQRDGAGTARNWRPESTDASLPAEIPGSAAGEPLGQRGQPWQHAEAVECDDGWRRIEPGAQPLVNGLPGRLDMLRGYGNAIVPQVAAEFIGAYMDILLTPPLTARQRKE